MAWGTTAKKSTSAAAKKTAKTAAKTAATGAALRKARNIWGRRARRVEAERAERRRKTLIYGSVAGALAAAAGGFIAWRLVRSRREPVSMTGMITVSVPRHEAYSFWRNFENFPRFMRHIDDVRVIDQRRSQWVVNAAPGAHAEWEAEIIEERQNERIAWQSVDGAPVAVLGEVRFEDAPGGGTEVHVTLIYTPTQALRGQVARLFRRGLQAEMRADLGRFKQFIETGEVATTEGQPSGGSRRRWFRRAGNGFARTADRLESRLTAQGG